MSGTTSTIQVYGAMGFGALIGWFVYYINRYRKGDVSWSDLTTLIGILGGGAILALFPEQTDLFGAYGIGLFIGFFGYFIFLVIWVRLSRNFSVDWFLDGRRSVPRELITGVQADSTRAAMEVVPGIETRTKEGSLVDTSPTPGATGMDLDETAGAAAGFKD